MNIREVARLAHVSPSTVSRVLSNTAVVNEETRLRVLRVIEEVGYMPNSMKRHEKTIALVVPTSFAAQAYWATAILDGVLDGAAEHYVTIMRIPKNVAPKEQRLHKWRDHTRRAGLCGAIVVASSQSHIVTHDLREADVPYVILGNGDNHEHWVWCENVKIVHHALDNLKRRGYDRIAFVGRDANEPDLVDRLTAYRTWAAHKQQYACEVLTGANFAQRLRQLFTSEQRPNALFAASLLVAMEALKVSKELGISVPEELGFITMAESPLLEAWSPPLLLIERQLQEAARLATETILYVSTHNPESPKQITLLSALREGGALVD